MLSSQMPGTSITEKVPGIFKFTNHLSITTKHCISYNIPIILLYKE